MTLISAKISTYIHTSSSVGASPKGYCSSSTSPSLSAKLHNDLTTYNQQ